MKEVAYSVAMWDPHYPTLDEFLDHLAGFIRGLREIDPVFSELYLTGNRAKQELRVDDDPGNLENFLRTKWPKSFERSYTDTDERGRPRLTPLSSAGWNLKLGASTGRSRGKRSSTFKLYAHPGGASPGTPGIVKMFAGPSRSLLKPEVDRPGMVKISVFDRNSPLLDPEVSERLFRYLVEFWNPDHAITTEEIFEARSGWFGWLNYWDDPDLARHLPDWVHRESLSKGVFFHLGDGRVLSKKDTEEVRTGLAIMAAMWCRTDRALSKKDIDKVHDDLATAAALLVLHPDPELILKTTQDALRKLEG